MEPIYAIPVTDAFRAAAETPASGCPFCALSRKLEEDELDRILGAAMMEPDTRIETNRKGFCRIHYDRMFTRKNRLGMALMLESHLHDLRQETADGALDTLSGRAGNRAVRRIAKLESTCYVCERIEYHFTRMIDTAVMLWEEEEGFPALLSAQPYFCLPHYRALLEAADNRLSRKAYTAFARQAAVPEDAYFDKLRGDISWFCKKFDYRYEEEPWYDAKDAIERAIRFLASDLHTKE